MLISVIVTTYLWPEALELCLQSLAAQRDRQFEVLIAEDADTEVLRKKIPAWRQMLKMDLIHVSQADEGFRAGTIRNKAVARCKGQYLIFLDGDCMVFPDFISGHRSLAESGYFVPGNRILVSETFTPQVLQHKLPLYRYGWQRFLNLWRRGQVNRLFPLIRTRAQQWRKRHPRKWQKAMTCNLAVWRKDFIAVNGFDELYQGWGYEDSDLVIRLIHAGVFRKEGRFCVPVLHLWHRQNERGQESANLARLNARLADTSCIRAERGVDQWLAEA